MAKLVRNRWFLWGAGVLAVLLIALLVLPYLLLGLSRWHAVPAPVRYLALRGADVMLASSFNQPLRLYGQVLDQTGTPVAGAQIKLEYSYGSAGQRLTSGSGAPRTQDFTLSTDDHGRFACEKSGTHLLVRSITKPGYRAEEKLWNFDPPYRGTPETPEIFRVWHLQAPERLNKIYDIQHRAGDGQIFSVTFTEDHPRVTPGRLPEVDLYVTLHYPETTDRPRHFDWSCDVEVPEGGVVVHHDAYPFLAPEVGYEPKLHFAMEAGNPRWQDDGGKRFYLKARGGAVYGDVSLSVNIDQTKACGGSFGFWGHLNPRGSRNLQLGNVR